MIQFVENLGNNVINYSVRMYDFFIFLFKCIKNLFSIQSYSTASREFFIEQIYLSCIKHLLSFFISALFLGSILIVIAITFARNFGLENQIGDLLVLFVVDEFSPLFTAIFFILTYTIVSQESIQDIRLEKENLFNEVYIPKLLNTIIMLPLMSLLFATVMMASGYVVSSFYLHIDFITYKNMIINSIALSNILMLLFKGILFGFVSMMIPIYYGHKRQKGDSRITKTIIKILIIILSMLFLIELLSILIFY